MNVKNLGFKLSVLILTFLAFISMFSTSYSLWFEILGINVNVNMGEFKLHIGSCKALSCYSGVNVDCRVVNRKELQLYVENAFPGWEGWIGLVIENEGTVPATLYGVDLISTGELSSYIGISNMYLYGPYKRSFRDVWGRVGCNDLPFPGYTSPPVVIEPGYKVVVWIKTSIDESAPYGSTGSLKILLRFSQ